MTTKPLIATAAIALLTLASCGKATDSTTGLTTLQSPLPSLSINANQIAMLYRQAKAAGATEFQGNASSSSIVTALESGVHGSGIHSTSEFKISPLKEDDRDKTIALLEGILGH